jgi:aldehyde dehydrogenase (NAD+)
MPDMQAYNRMTGLIASGRLLVGGDRDPQQKAIEPTVIDRLPDDSPLFTEEVFGPLLPVREFATEEEVLRILGNQERPLAAYCFGGSKKFIRTLQENYSCGALVFNDVPLHFTNMHIPFGGVGASGFGAYHGVKTFTTFTHEKPVMEQTTWIDLPFRYPPHSRLMRRLIEFFNRLG